MRLTYTNVRWLLQKSLEDDHGRWSRASEGILGVSEERPPPPCIACMTAAKGQAERPLLSRLELTRPPSARRPSSTLKAPPPRTEANVARVWRSWSARA